MATRRSGTVGMLDPRLSAEADRIISFPQMPKMFRCDLQAPPCVYSSFGDSLYPAWKISAFPRPIRKLHINFGRPRSSSSVNKILVNDLPRYAAQAFTVSLPLWTSLQTINLERKDRLKENDVECGHRYGRYDLHRVREPNK